MFWNNHFTNSNEKVFAICKCMKKKVLSTVLGHKYYIPVSQQGYWGSEAWLIFTYNAVYGWVKDLSEMDIFNNLMAQ